MNIQDKSSCSPACNKKSKKLNHYLYAVSIEIVLYASILVYKVANKYDFTKNLARCHNKHILLLPAKQLFVTM
jgi:hypothetical protein